MLLDRTSCPKATANQFRLFLHAGAYWLLWRLRTLMPKHSSWRVAQFDTLRLRLIKIAARIVEDENQDQSPSANQHSRSSGLALGSRPPAAADPMNAGAVRPAITRSRPTPSPITQTAAHQRPKPACEDTTQRCGNGCIRKR